MGDAWYESSELEVESTQLLRVELAVPDLSGFSDFVSRRINVEHDTEAEALFDDALFDLTRLLEEVGFEAAVALTYLRASQDARKELNKTRTTGLQAMPLSAKIQALLAPYHAFLPLPAELIANPSASMTGFRILGGWWAAQLIDSALIRAVAALDRIASLLTAATNAPINPDRMPAFRKDDLKALRPYYSGNDWDQLRALLNNPLFLWLKDYRDGFIHRRRTPMELHGDHTVMNPDGKFYRGLDPGSHFAFVTAFHDQVVKPACELGGRLVLTKLDGSLPKESDAE